MSLEGEAAGRVGGKLTGWRRQGMGQERNGEKGQEGEEEGWILEYWWRRNQRETANTIRSEKISSKILI